MLKNNKDILRKKMLTLRQEQDLALAQFKSIKAQEILLEQKFWQEAQSVALYMPISGEVDTKLLLEKAWQCTKTVLLPRCTTNIGIMDFYICKDYTDLTLGKFNIMEPHNGLEEWNTKIDLIILPGVAFDYKGYRLGFGAGYYDRYLEKTQTNFCVGLAYNWQIVSEISMLNKWDKPVNAVLSEEGVLWT